jgi:hypothetical protein
MILIEDIHPLNVGIDEYQWNIIESLDEYPNTHPWKKPWL